MQCNCQLYLLQQWYQNQHHQEGSADASTKGSNWTCTVAPTNTSSTTPTPPSASTPHSPSAAAQTTEDPPGSGQRLVTEMGDCQDTETHCQTVEHAEHHLKGSSQVTRGDRG